MEIELDEHGLPGRHNCPTCGAPLTPVVLEAGDRLGVVYQCPEHGAVSAPADPFG